MRISIRSTSAWSYRRATIMAGIGRATICSARVWWRRICGRGKWKWYYQYVHHGIWDMDNPCPPILADITINGRTVKAVAQPTKQAFLYVLNRETGQPIWPIVRKAGGEVATFRASGIRLRSLSRPSSPAYDRQGISIDDLINFSPAMRAEAEQVVSRYKIGPMFTPGSLSKPEGPLATLTLATAGGGSNWPGGSYDPETHVVYVSSQAAVPRRSDWCREIKIARTWTTCPERCSSAGGRGGGRGAAAAAGGGRGRSVAVRRARTSP